MKIIAIYDNGEESIERYTVYFDSRFNTSGTLNDCLALSSNPNHPQGFSQFCGGQLGKHNEKKVTFSQLPKNIQEHIKQRIK